MSALSSRLRGAQGGALFFWCPGCECVHGIQVGSGPGPRLGWNGDPVRPTFTPSVLVRSGHYADGCDPAACFICKERRENPTDVDGSWTCRVCHSFVTDGRIQFLGDSTHALAGQTVDMPEHWEFPS